MEWIILERKETYMVYERVNNENTRFIVNRVCQIKVYELLYQRDDNYLLVINRSRNISWRGWQS